MRIFHIIKSGEWQKAKTDGVYHPQSLDKEGFIHASTKDQVIPTANRRYVGQKNLLLLLIDSNKIVPEIKFEYSKGTKEAHPHIYGELNLDAIEGVLDFNPENDGIFRNLPKNK